MTDPGGDPGGKISPRARQLRAEAGSDREIDLLIRTTAPAEGAARARLEAAGARVRTVAGDVCTASAALSSLDDLAGLPEVVAIEVSEELAPEAPRHIDSVEGGGP